MGDLMHALPALTEAKQSIDNISFDWVVDKAFASVPQWHPSVDKIITTDHRNWKKHLFSKASRNSFNLVKKEISNTHYDVVLDMQNNLKSAFLSYTCNQNVIGMDSKSSREYPAHWAYSSTVSVEKNQHAIDRQKKLLAFALGYETSKSRVDYGVDKRKFVKPNIDIPTNYTVLVQNASWTTKQWSIKNWQNLIGYLDRLKITMFFPSGNEEEFARASEIASVSNAAIALEPLPLDQIAYLIDHARYSICSDTGLAHLSALVDTPSLTLYGPTNTKLIGTAGTSQRHIVGIEGDINNITVEEVIRKLPVY
jgi:heptosyltransferase-1